MNNATATTPTVEATEQPARRFVILNIIDKFDDEDAAIEFWGGRYGWLELPMETPERIIGAYEYPTRAAAFAAVERMKWKYPHRSRAAQVFSTTEIWADAAEYILDFDYLFTNDLARQPKEEFASWRY